MERKEVLLMTFMGQSNMAGRGNASEAPALIQGAGWEYRAITAPDCLSPLCEPFGEKEDNAHGVTEPGMKTGSMVTAFVNACYAETNIPIVGVSCAKGGSSIAEWLPGTPYYKDAVERTMRCEQWLIHHGFTIRYGGMVWCQGCTDGDYIRLRMFIRTVRLDLSNHIVKNVQLRTVFSFKSEIIGTIKHCMCRFSRRSWSWSGNIQISFW